MASGPLLTSATPRTQQSVEPPFEWVRRDDRDTLLLDVSGFKKEQLKVQVGSQGSLKVAGERTIYGNQRSRFAKEFQVPDNCNVGEIRAKFQDGILYVIMPKSPMVPPLPPPPPPPPTTTTTTSTDANSSLEVEPTKTWHDEAGDYAGKAMERKEERGDNNGDGDGNSRFGFEAYEARCETVRSRRLIVNTLVVLMVALGIWIYFNYGFGSLLVEKHEATSE